MSVPSLLIALPLVVAVSVLWFWLIAKAIRWIVRPLDARIADLAHRTQETDPE